MIRTARDRGIRVIADLVPNHTSDQHPWFQAAREGPTTRTTTSTSGPTRSRRRSPATSSSPTRRAPTGPMTARRRRWYLHRFYSHQPDLNVANPEVRDELAQIAGFWLEQGLSGFRLDAVPFLVEPMGMPKGAIRTRTSCCATSPLHGPAQRRVDPARRGQPPARRCGEFFGERGGEQLDMQFSFTVNQALYLALAREDAGPLAAALEALPPIPQDCQWAQFVRNHDELTLDKLSEEEREEVFAAFGPDPGDADVRARPAPAAAVDARRRPAAHAARLLADVLAARHAGPVLRRGDRHGGEPRDRGRYAVRSPMQWSGEPNAGFTTADEPCRPLPADGPFGFPGQRRRASGATRLAAELDGAADPPPPRVPGARLGRVVAARAGRPGGLRAPRRLGRFDARRRAQPRRPGDAGAPRARRRGRARRPLRHQDAELDGELSLALEPYGARWFRLRRPGQRSRPSARARASGAAGRALRRSAASRATSAARIAARIASVASDGSSTPSGTSATSSTAAGQPLPVERVDVAPAEGDVREQVDRGAAEQRDRRHELERVLDVRRASSSCPARPARCRRPSGGAGTRRSRARCSFCSLPGPALLSRRAATSATTSK